MLVAFSSLLAINALVIRAFAVEVAPGTPISWERMEAAPRREPAPEVRQEVAALKAQLEEQKTVIEILKTREKESVDKVNVLNKEVQRYQAPLGRVVAVNPGWNFVLIDVGEQRGASVKSPLPVKRVGQPVLRLKTTSAELGSSIADVPPGPVVVASLSSQPSSSKGADLLDATEEGPFVNTLGMKFTKVPGTRVLLSVWDTRVRDYAAYARENEVDDTWTRERKAKEPTSREPEYPVVGVSWDDARAFCNWLTKKERAAGRLPRGAVYRLPTDEEWSRAVGLDSEMGATPAAKSGKDQVHFPWGLDFPPKEKVGNYADEAFHAVFPAKRNEKGNLVDAWIEGYTDGFTTTSPVGSFPANSFGLYDMGGNVWQWCEDSFGDSSRDRTLRGASWDYSERKFLLSSHRIHSAPTTRSFSHGFRCVMDVSGRSGR